MNKELFPVKVKKNEQLTPDAWLLKFERNFEFTPGQVIGITLDPGQQNRLYSIASGNTDTMVSILFTVKPDGILTPPLSVCKEGEPIFITRPFGNFICTEERAVFIATGTGIAPFASTLFSGNHGGKTLIYGNRTAQGLYFHESFIDILGNDYHPCLSRGQDEGYFHGRVTQYIDSLDPLDATNHYYLCGIAEMVVDVRDLLIEKGVPYNKIMAEIFF